jgi:hypothetical protein
MKEKIILIISTVASLLIIGSCSVDFNPNDSWKETTIVYGLLDQDQDTTFVRIEKCFLGEGNAISFSQIKDSLYYKEDELDVKMYAYWYWDTVAVVDSFTFNYSTTVKDSGSFFYDDNCPIYYCPTKGKLNGGMYYKLVVKNKKTGNIVSAMTRPIANYTINTSTLTFNQKATNNRAKINWTNIDDDGGGSGLVAKQFQVNIRFNYLQNGEIKYINIPVSKVINQHSTSVSMTSYVTMNDIVSGIKTKLKGQTNLSWYSTYPMQLYILACDRSMFDYMSINNTQDNLLSYKPTYSNINNGIGLFAARRTKNNVKFTDKQISSELKTAIVGLGLGF